MKTKIEYKLDLSADSTDRRILKDLKNLFIYVCVTRFGRYYKSYDDYKKQMRALNNTKSTYGKLCGKTSSEYQKNQAIRRDRFNACFSISSDLLKDIRGYYRDENKRLHRRQIEPFINYLLQHKFLAKVDRHGCKHNSKFKEASEKIESRHWTNKYFLNQRLWFKLLKESKYSDLTTFPMRAKLKQLIGTYYKKFTKEELDSAMTKQQEEEHKAKLANGETSITVEQLKKFEAKKKRKNEKRNLTIAKKAAKQTLAEYDAKFEQLKAEIEQLKTEIERLKQYKDLNSDIQDDDDRYVIDVDDVDDVDDVESRYRLAETNAELDKQIEEKKKSLNAKEQEETTAEDNLDDYDAVVNKPKVITRLQEFIDELYISFNEAKTLQSIAMDDTRLKENKAGFCQQDAAKHCSQRYQIFRAVYEKFKIRLNQKQKKYLSTRLKIEKERLDEEQKKLKTV